MFGLSQSGRKFFQAYLGAASYDPNTFIDNGKVGLRLGSGVEGLRLVRRYKRFPCLWSFCSGPKMCKEPEQKSKFDGIKPMPVSREKVHQPGKRFVVVKPNSRQFDF